MVFAPDTLAAFLSTLTRVARPVLKLAFPRYLFDRDFYVARYPDVGKSGYDPYFHWFRYGVHEGRWPSRFFDTEFYKSQQHGRVGKRMNPLVHYRLIGRASGLRPFRYFEPSFYLERNPDVAVSKFDPFEHYSLYGADENRSAAPNFDPFLYIANAGGIAFGKGSAIRHYLLHGPESGLLPVPRSDPTLRKQAGVAETPKHDALNMCLSAGSRRNSADVDVVVPVYRGRTATLTCLASVLTAKAETAFRLVVINDCSPDEALAKDLREIGRKGVIQLVENSENCGFVATSNLGMRQSNDADVVLLNSDTEVYDHWLDRLGAHAAADDNIGTVTPLTNNGTICSYPHFDRDNPLPLEVNYEDLDRAIATVNANCPPVALPSAVGFCMYVRRRLLDSIGGFDEEAFDKGYGEENDFSQRAERAGFLNVAAPNVFVRHHGAMSFREEKSDRLQAALEIMETRYPTYHNIVQSFLEADALRPARANIDEWRLKRMAKGKSVLIVTHSRGGGTDVHVNARANTLRQHGTPVFWIRTTRRNRTRVAFGSFEAPDLPNLNDLSLIDDLDALVEWVETLNVFSIEIHSLADFTFDGIDAVREFLVRAGRPVAFVIHDYHPICPRITLTNKLGEYCYEPDESGCNICVLRNGTEYGEPAIDQWRARNHKVLQLADTIVVPDEDVANRLKNYWPEFLFEVQSNESKEPYTKKSGHARRRRSDRLTIGVIGAISAAKGFHLLVTLAKLASEEHPDIRFVVVGSTENDAHARKAGIVVSGSYERENLPELLLEFEIDAIFLPSRWPETYSFTLSEAMDAALPVAVFDIGAPARRLRETGYSPKVLVPTNSEPAEILAMLRRLVDAGSMTAATGTDTSVEETNK